MILLSSALILALQTVDWLTATPDMPLLVDVRGRLLALYQTPLASENAWIYITLFSTLVPSVAECSLYLRAGNPGDSPVSLVPWCMKRNSSPYLACS